MYEFFYKCLEKKEIKNKTKIHNKLYDIINKRKKFRNDLEKKLYGKEEEIYTFSPKINKTLNFNKPLNQNYYNNMSPIIIVPATSRIYFHNGSSKSNNILYNYARKSIYDKNNENFKTLNDLCLNNNYIIRKDENYNYFHKNGENNKTFRERSSYNNDIFNNYDTDNKTNKFSESKEIFSYHIRDFINNNISKKIETTKKNQENKKINEIYYNDFTKKMYNKSALLKKRRNKSIKQRKSLNTNNETKGFTVSTFSTKDFQNVKTNSKRDSNSEISNYTSSYKTKSIKKRNKVNKANEKNENISLQSISDSKIMELAEYYLDKKGKDEFLEELGIKKIFVFNKNKNK